MVSTAASVTFLNSFGNFVIVYYILFLQSEKCETNMWRFSHILIDYCLGNGAQLFLLEYETHNK